MASGFFALFDDIAVLMDDVAAMSKIATKKTAGLLGDDLAVNAEKATGFVSSRELPVIWAITKGSFLNKIIILPLVVLMSMYLPKAIIPILLVGGLYLAYEGVEKIYEYIFPHHAPKNTVNSEQDLSNEDILAREKEKIRSAIITDFILSLEIIIIGLSTVSKQPIEIQIPVLIVIAIFATIGVYGIVALIVRLDDVGYKLIARGKKEGKQSLRKIGLALVKSLPYIIKALAIIGTIAMLMVAGGIYRHNIDAVHDFVHKIPSFISEILIGLVIGIVMLFILNPMKWLYKRLFKKTS